MKKIIQNQFYQGSYKGNPKFGDPIILYDMEHERKFILNTEYGSVTLMNYKKDEKTIEYTNTELNKKELINTYQITKKPSNSQDPFLRRYFSEMQREIPTIYSLAFSSDCRYLVTGDLKGNIVIWNIEEKKFVREIKAHKMKINNLDVSSDNRFVVSVSDDNTARIWNFDTGEEVHSKPAGHLSQVTCVAISSDNSFYVTGGYDGIVKVWRVEDNEILLNLDIRNRASVLFRGPVEFERFLPVVDIKISSDDAYVVSAHVDTVRVWDIRGVLKGGESNEKEKIQFNGLIKDLTFKEEGARIPQIVVSVAMTNDSQQIYIGYLNNCIGIWSTQESALKSKINLPEQVFVSCMHLTSDNLKIIPGSFLNRVCVCNHNGGIVKEFHGIPPKDHTWKPSIDDVAYGYFRLVRMIKLSSDENLIAAGSRDGIARVWDFETCQSIVEFNYQKEIARRPIIKSEIKFQRLSSSDIKAYKIHISEEVLNYRIQAIIQVPHAQILETIQECDYSEKISFKNVRYDMFLKKIDNSKALMVCAEVKVEARQISLHKTYYIQSKFLDDVKKLDISQWEYIKTYNPENPFESLPSFVLTVLRLFLQEFGLKLCYDNLVAPMFVQKIIKDTHKQGYPYNLKIINPQRHTNWEEGIFKHISRFYVNSVQAYQTTYLMLLTYHIDFTKYSKWLEKAIE